MKASQASFSGLFTDSVSIILKVLPAVIQQQECWVRVFLLHGPSVDRSICSPNEALILQTPLRKLTFTHRSMNLAVSWNLEISCSGAAGMPIVAMSYLWIVKSYRWTTFYNIYTDCAITEKHIGTETQAIIYASISNHHLSCIQGHRQEHAVSRKVWDRKAGYSCCEVTVLTTHHHASCQSNQLGIVMVN